MKYGYRWLIARKFDRLVGSHAAEALVKFKSVHCFKTPNLHSSEESDALFDLALRRILIFYHYNDVMMTAMASQITSLTMFTQRFIQAQINENTKASRHWRHFVKGIHRWPVNSPHEGPVTREVFPFDDVIMMTGIYRHKEGPWHLPICTIWAWPLEKKNLVKFGTFWVQTLRNAYLWNRWADLLRSKFYGIV